MVAYVETVCADLYGVVAISRLLKTTGLFCRRALSKRRYSAEATYHFKEPTNRSHLIRETTDSAGQTKKRIPDKSAHTLLGLVCRACLLTRRPTKETYKKDLQKRPQATKVSVQGLFFLVSYVETESVISVQGLFHEACVLYIRIHETQDSYDYEVSFVGLFCRSVGLFCWSLV